MHFKKEKNTISIILTWSFILCFLFIAVKISYGNTSKISVSNENNNIIIKEQDEEITVQDLLNNNNSLLLFAKNPLWGPCKEQLVQLNDSHIQNIKNNNFNVFLITERPPMANMECESELGLLSLDSISDKDGFIKSHLNINEENGYVLFKDGKIIDSNFNEKYIEDFIKKYINI